jgi:hypothetical protein
LLQLFKFGTTAEEIAVIAWAIAAVAYVKGAIA